ncbi:MAG: choice-of-anchor tandem repeat GloVer-containing protein [Candidatus Sulfotelmatobacter sp.]
MRRFESGTNDGSTPYGPLSVDKRGNVYGTTSGGGTFGGSLSGGVAFKISPVGSSWSESILWNFGGPGDSSYVLSGLVPDSIGNFYGTSFFGGGNGYGSVFKLSPPAAGGIAWTESVLHSFESNSVGGEYLQSSLSIDSQGTLYGAASGSGYNCCGSIFRMMLSSSGNWSFESLYTFGVSRKTKDGNTPVGVTIDSRTGRLYGITEFNTYNQQGASGVVFELAPPSATANKWAYSVLHNFYKTNETNPKTPLFFDLLGNIYGATESSGGTSAGGAFYKITRP